MSKLTLRVQIDTQVLRRALRRASPRKTAMNTPIDDSATLNSPCRHCLQKIPDGASICTHCKQHQSRWSNARANASSVAAAVSVVGAAATYMITTVPEVRKLFAWKEDVAILNFTTRKGLSLANVGDGVVHISHLDLRATHPDGKHLFLRTIQITHDLEKGKFHRSTGEDEMIKGARLNVAEHDTQEAFVKDLSKSGEMTKVVTGEKCFLWVVYNADNPLLATYAKHLGPKLHRFPVEADLTYYSYAMRRQIKQKVDVVGMLQQSNHEKCTPSMPSK